MRTSRDPAEPPARGRYLPVAGKAAGARMCSIPTAAGGLIIRGGALRLAATLPRRALSVLSDGAAHQAPGRGMFSQYTTVISLVSVVSVMTDAGMSTWHP